MAAIKAIWPRVEEKDILFACSDKNRTLFGHFSGGSVSHIEKAPQQSARQSARQSEKAAQSAAAASAAATLQSTLGRGVGPIPAVSHPIGKRRAEQLQQQLRDYAFSLGMGDIQRTEELIRGAFQHREFQYFLDDFMTEEQKMDKLAIDNLCSWLGKLTGEGQGRIGNEAEQMRRLVLMALTGERSLPVATQNRLADRMETDRRYLKKIHATAEQFWKSGELLDITKCTAKPRKDKRADADIISRGWHNCGPKSALNEPPLRLYIALERAPVGAI